MTIDKKALDKIIPEIWGFHQIGSAYVEDIVRRYESSRTAPDRERIIEAMADALWHRFDPLDEIGRVGIIPNRFVEAAKCAYDAMLKIMVASGFSHSSDTSAGGAARKGTWTEATATTEDAATRKDAVGLASENPSSASVTQPVDCRAEFEKWLTDSGLIEGLNSHAWRAWRDAWNLRQPKDK